MIVLTWMRAIGQPETAMLGVFRFTSRSGVYVSMSSVCALCRASLTR